MKKSRLPAVAVLVAVLSLLLAVAAAADCEPPPCPPPEPPPCGEGCTPGYWKQPQHLDSWVGYSPDDYFDDVFGTSGHDDMTLLEALQAKGPGSELLRHGVAGLLNAVSPGVDYAGTGALVITAVQEGDAEVLVMHNELFCPLN